MAINLIKLYNGKDLRGNKFAVYSPRLRGSLPKADLLFSWKGLEQFNFDEIISVFRDAESADVKYAIMKNMPGARNAMLRDLGGGTFSVERSLAPWINFRGYPFGFGIAERVIPINGAQLLMYNTSEIRHKW